MRKMGESEAIMSKKIKFTNVNKETIATINTILEVNFTVAFVRNELSIAKKALEVELEDARLEDRPTIEIQKKLTLIDYKKKALASWRKEQLFPTKKDKKIISDGLYAAIGLTMDLVGTYADCKSAGTWGKWNKSVKTMLAEVFQFDTLDEKLVSKFATYLEHQVGSNVSGTKQILNGVLLKENNANKVMEILANSIATYMQKTCDSVIIPTVEFYTASVEFDENIKTVTSFTVSEKEEEKEEEKED